MTNAKSLLKKAELFERLAVYGDRRAFLKSLAFDLEDFNAALSVTKKYLADAKNIVGGEAAIMPEPTDVDQIASQIERVTKLVNTMPDASKKNPATSNLLAARTSLKRTKELAPELPQVPEEPPAYESGEMTMPEEQIKGNRPGSSISKQDQAAVFKFVTLNGIGIPGKIDGILGQETRRALEAIKNYFAKAHPQNPRMSDQQAINAAKFEGR